MAALGYFNTTRTKNRARTTHQSKTATDTKFEDLAIPTKMSRWSADLSYLEAFLNPDQCMENLFTKEFAIAGKKGPSVYPFAVPELRKTLACPHNATRTSEQSAGGYLLN